jgi:hypothetical protein
MSGCTIGVALGCYDAKFVSREDREDFKDVSLGNRAERALSRSIHLRALCARRYAALFKIFASFA